MRVSHIIPLGHGLTVSARCVVVGDPLNSILQDISIRNVRTQDEVGESISPRDRIYVASQLLSRAREQVRVARHA